MPVGSISRTGMSFDRQSHGIRSLEKLGDTPMLKTAVSILSTILLTINIDTISNKDILMT
jgi:hypothetical protein